MRAGAAAVAGAAVGGVVSASPADTTDNNLKLGRANDSGQFGTGLKANSSNPALDVANTSVGPALAATGHPIAEGGAVAAPGNGPALSVQGVAIFTRSGLATVPTGVRSVIINVPGGLSAFSGGFAMTQGPGPITGAVALDPATGTLTIFLIGVTSFPTNVAWFVFG